MRIFVAAALTLALALPAGARSLNRTEAQGLSQALTAYSAALTGADAAALTQSLPPRLLRFHAGLTGMEPAALEQAMTEQTAAMMARTRFGALQADPAAAEASVGKLADGSRVTWAVLPATFTIEQDGTVSRVDQPVLALREGEQWYLLRVDPGQQKVLAAVYPFLAEIDLPQMVVTPLQ